MKARLNLNSKKTECKNEVYHRTNTKKIPNEHAKERA